MFDQLKQMLGTFGLSLDERIIDNFVREPDSTTEEVVDLFSPTHNRLMHG